MVSFMGLTDEAAGCRSPHELNIQHKLAYFIWNFWNGLKILKFSFKGNVTECIGTNSLNCMTWECDECDEIKIRCFAGVMYIIEPV